MLGPQLILLASLITRSATLHYRRELGLERNEWRMIAVVGLSKGITLGALADQIGLDKGQLSREVSALVTRDLMVKSRASRSVIIRLSARGEKVFRALMTRAQARGRQLMAGLDPKTRDNLFAVLDVLQERAQETLRQEQSQPKLR